MGNPFVTRKSKPTITRQALSSTTLTSAGRINTFARSVRWVQQRGKLLGLMRPVEPGIWEITDTGRRRLRTSRPGLVITIFVTERGGPLSTDTLAYIVRQAGQEAGLDVDAALAAHEEVA
jgi:hypothetical protein